MAHRLAGTESCKGLAMTFDGEIFEGLKTFLAWLGVVVLVIGGVLWTYIREKKP
jgi:hypothetical protein